MLRLIFYIALLGGLVVGGLWLESQQGMIHLQWQGWLIETSVPVVVAAFVIAVLLALFVLYAVIELVSIPGRVRNGMSSKGREKGYHALNEAMLSIAVNDHSHAKKLLQKARYYLGDDNAAARLCAVQLSHIKGDTAAVRHQLDEMTRHSDTELIGWRGKAKQAVNEKKITKAHEAALEAWKLQQNDRELADLLLSLSIKKEDWITATEVLAKGKKHKYYSNEERRHSEALLHFLRAKTALSDDMPEKASERLQLSLMRDSGFLPSQILRGRLLQESGEKKAWFGWVQKAWSQQPLPEYAQAFWALFADEAITKLRKRVQKLVKLNPQHVESHLLMAQLALREEAWDNARNHIKMALSQQTSARIYERMAEVEKLAASEAEAATWLRRAMQLPRAQGWHCNACGCEHEEWVAHCTRCDAFDSLQWKLPNAQAEEEPGLLVTEYQAEAEAHPHSSEPQVPAVSQ